MQFKHDIFHVLQSFQWFFSENVLDFKLRISLARLSAKISDFRSTPRECRQFVAKIPGPKPPTNDVLLHKLFGRCNILPANCEVTPNLCLPKCNQKWTLILKLLCKWSKVFAVSFIHGGHILATYAALYELKAIYFWLHTRQVWSARLTNCIRWN